MGKAVVTLGETMMRLSPPANGRLAQANSFNMVFGGSESNVASCLSVLGKQAEHVTCIPENDLGDSLLGNLKWYGVGISRIKRGEGKMGVYFLETGAAQRSSRIVYDRFGSAFSKIDPDSIDWDAIMKEAGWFHYSGITPAISANAAQACLDAVTAANKYNVTVSGDVNYRRNLWQYGKTPIEIMPGLIEKTNIMVAGAEEFRNCMGIEEDDFVTACGLAMEKFPSIKKITTTLRETINATHNKLQGLLWNGKELLTTVTHNIYPIVDRLGTGDAFMSGLIYGWLEGMEDKAALNFGVAAGVLKHSVEGEVNMVSVNEIMQLAQGENTGKLLR